MSNAQKGLQQALVAERRKRQAAEAEAWIRKTYANFMKDDTSVEEAIISSTKASWGGSGYSVELFPDGNYRVLWDNQIGNRYDSPGLIISLPTLGDEEWDEENGHFFDNALECLDQFLEDCIEQMKDGIFNE
ncbi:MAG: hypothetical protein ACRC8Y_24420 [Chroococcales cyanobacterium]